MAWQWRGNDVAMAMTLLPMASWRCQYRCCEWRVGDGVAMAMTSLPIARWRWQWRCRCGRRRCDGDDSAADGVAVAMPILPMASLQWRGNSDADAANFELAMAMSMMLRPTALRWRRQCCRRRGGGDADVGDGEFAMAWQWR